VKFLLFISILFSSVTSFADFCTKEAAKIKAKEAALAIGQLDRAGEAVSGTVWGEAYGAEYNHWTVRVYVRGNKNTYANVYYVRLMKRAQTSCPVINVDFFRFVK
jgi:hypothetical protein